MSRQKNADNPIQLESFAKFLNNYIISNQLTNAGFGALIGKDEGTIRKYRQGKNLPSHDTKQKILSVTHTRYHEALWFVDPKIITNSEGQD